MTQLQMVEEFLCPGCVCGSDTKCGKYKPCDDGSGCCGHVMGTMMPMIGGGVLVFALGLPKGFNRGGICWDRGRWHAKMEVRLVTAEDPKPSYDHLNVPVWALERDGFLFVRVAMPRTGNWAVDVVEGGKMAEVCPQAFDVGSVYGEID